MHNRGKDPRDGSVARARGRLSRRAFLAAAGAATILSTPPGQALRKVTPVNDRLRARLAAVSLRPPMNEAPPAIINSSPKVGDTLVVTTGTWS
jgi:hypothetical protein